MDAKEIEQRVETVIEMNNFSYPTAEKWREGFKKSLVRAIQKMITDDKPKRDEIKTAIKRCLFGQEYVNTDGFADAVMSLLNSKKQCEKCGQEIR